LEAYAIGELSDIERAEVERNLFQYAELRLELSKIEEAQETLLQKLAIAPPTDIKAKVMQQVQTPGKVVTLDVAWKFAAAASVVLALFLGYLAYDYRDRWIHAQVALNDLVAQNQQVAQDYNRVNLRLDKMESDLKVINDPSFVKVVMKGTPNAPQSLASIYWNKDTKEVYLSIQNMRELAKEKQYQLWAIIDGKPVDAGVFDGDVAGLIRMKEVATGAVTFAVTVEPRGGKPTPSLETMQVAGNVTKS
jgi:anti-sigma-K factor RskA